MSILIPIKSLCNVRITESYIFMMFGVARNSGLPVVVFSGFPVVVRGSMTRNDSRVTTLVTDGASTRLANTGSMEGVSACKYCQVLKMDLRGDV